MNPTGTDERVAKLPRWAQDHIRVLEMRLREQTERADMAEAAMNVDGVLAEDVDTVANTYATKPISLGRGTNVQFRLDQNDPTSYVEARVARDRNDGTYLDLRSGSGQIAVFPRASNSCEVRVPQPPKFRPR